MLLTCTQAHEHTHTKHKFMEHIQLDGKRNNLLLSRDRITSVFLVEERENIKPNGSYFKPDRIDLILSSNQQKVGAQTRGCHEGVEIWNKQLTSHLKLSPEDYLCPLCNKHISQQLNKLPFVVRASEQPAPKDSHSLTDSIQQEICSENVQTNVQLVKRCLICNDN